MANKTRSVMQVDMYVDGDGVTALFHRNHPTKTYTTATYRCSVYDGIERKRRLVGRVAAAQMALCRTVYQVCEECGAVAYGNLFCNTCRTAMNAIGFNLPPWPHPAEAPATAEDVQRFIDKLDKYNGEHNDE